MMRFLYRPQNMTKNKNCSTETEDVLPKNVTLNIIPGKSPLVCYLHPEIEIETRRPPKLLPQPGPGFDQAGCWRQRFSVGNVSQITCRLCQFVVRSPSIGIIRNDEKILTAGCYCWLLHHPSRDFTSQTSFL